MPVYLQKKDTTPIVHHLSLSRQAEWLASRYSRYVYIIRTTQNKRKNGKKPR